MNILIIDPFYEYSHKIWAEGFQKHSSHQIEILKLSPHHWKWRMTGGAVELAEKYKELNKTFDLIIASDMLDLSSFISLASIDRNRTSTAIYFHENQISYPWTQTNDKLQNEKNHHYGFINFTSCLSADRIFYNSHFHKRNFLESLEPFIKIFPDFRHQQYLEQITKKSMVLPLGLDIKHLINDHNDTPCFIWNHRWEYDKNPNLFFKTLYQLKEQKIKFELIVVGKSYKRKPDVFDEAKKILNDEIIHFGYVDAKDDYDKLISRANILMVTSNQDFFGISIVESIAAGLYPILPNRLAYPEHIPADQHKNHFYQKEEELFPLLKEIILNKHYLRDSIIAKYQQKYDWKNLIELYDTACANLQKAYI